jgi:hypothetical protein
MKYYLKAYLATWQAKYLIRQTNKFFRCAKKIQGGGEAGGKGF